MKLRNKIFIIFLILIFLLSFSLISCDKQITTASKISEKTTTIISKEEAIDDNVNDTSKMLTDKDTGASINLKVSNTFQIKLESNITTGYSWSLAKDTNSEILDMVSSEYVQPSKNKNVVGSSGYEIFTFKAVKIGQTDLVLEYQRPWEDNRKPANTFKISVMVE